MDGPFGVPFGPVRFLPPPLRTDLLRSDQRHGRDTPRPGHPSPGSPRTSNEGRLELGEGPGPKNWRPRIHVMRHRRHKDGCANYSSWSQALWTWFGYKDLCFCCMGEGKATSPSQFSWITDHSSSSVSAVCCVGASSTMRKEARAKVKIFEKVASSKVQSGPKTDAWRGRKA